MKSDVMIMIPVFNETLDINSIKTKQNSTDDLTSTLMKNIVPEIHKTFLKDITYYKIDDTKLIYENEKVDCPVYLFFDKQSNIGAVQIYIRDTEIDGSYIAHNIDNNDILVEESGKVLNTKEYVSTLGLIQCGDLRGLYNMDLSTDENKIKDILTGGTSLRMNMNQKEYDKIKLEKIDIFEDWPLYAGRKEVIQLSKEYSFLKNYNEWIIYHVSIALMQFTAVYKANKAIEKELMYKHSIDENKSLKILEEFGICNNLYSCNMFSHTRSKQVAERLRDIFDTDERYSLYKDNKELLFSIADLREKISGKKVEDLLFVVGIVCSVAGILDLFADWLGPCTLLNWIVGPPLTVTAIWSIYMFIKLKNRKYDK